MSHSLYQEDTPAEVKNAKVSLRATLENSRDRKAYELSLQGLHLITQSTPNGQKVQIMLEELKDIYGTEWTTTLM